MMADAETCPLTPSHPPKPAALRSFTTILPEIKRQLIHLRHTHDKHEPQYFAAVSSLSDGDLTSFTPEDLVAVRVGSPAYGIILFGKVRIPKAEMPGGGKGYVFVRWFVGVEDLDHDGEEERGEVESKFHSIYTEDKKGGDGKLHFRAIMGDDDVSTLLCFCKTAMGGLLADTFFDGDEWLTCLQELFFFNE